MLKRIELHGFKSFAKRGELNFDNQITAIVGPNGSGKSNTAEAFRFVLGEQGGKVMRVKKGVDLIWGGSHTLPKGSRASVRIMLDNTSGALPIEYTEVVIERVVHRDGTNEYKINDAKVRLKDVQDLLAGAHIGSTGHHIISQGQADRIIGATPRERKEMIEDALGLKIFQLKKHESMRKLSATAENLEKLESKRREIVPHMRYLEKQVKRIEEARDLKHQLRNLALSYFAQERERINAVVEQARTALSEPERELSEVSERIAVLRERIQDVAHTEHNDESGGNHTEADEAKERLIRARSELAEVRTELGRVDGEMRAVERMRSTARDSGVTISAKELLTLLTEIRDMLNKRDIKQAMAHIDTSLKRYSAENNDDNAAAFASELRELEARRRELLEQVSALERSVAEAEAQLRESVERERAEQSQQTELERDLYKETARYNALKAEVDEHRRVFSDAERDTQRMRDDIGAVQVLLGEQLVVQDWHDSAESQEQVTRDGLERLKIRLEQYGHLSTDIVDEYQEVRGRYEYLSEQIHDLGEAREKLTEVIADLEQTIATQFERGVSHINQDFKRFFNTLFGGGEASLRIVELQAQGDDESGEARAPELGIEVQVTLPRKKVSTLETLSGGERALASIALIFAMSQVKPPPFIILDETDAALDEANSARYAEIVRELSAKSKVILITHNRATMAAADTLYGVTMGNDGVSQLLSVQLADAESYAK